MIDKLRKYAENAQFLRLPAIAVGTFCLITAIVIIFDSDSNSGEQYLIPSIVGVIWALSAYTFIVTFQSVPKKMTDGSSVFGKLTRRLHRSWYWIVTVVFVGTTLFALYFTNSIISVWLKDQAG